jgi:hypothetical protein
VLGLDRFEPTCELLQLPDRASRPSDCKHKSCDRILADWKAAKRPDVNLTSTDLRLPLQIFTPGLQIFRNTTVQCTSCSRFHKSLLAGCSLRVKACPKCALRLAVLARLICCKSARDQLFARVSDCSCIVIELRRPPAYVSCSLGRSCCACSCRARSTGAASAGICPDC